MQLRRGLTRSAQRRSRGDRLFTWSIAAIAVLKMLTIWGNETIPEGSDSVQYLAYAHEWFWGFAGFPVRGPVFPLWVAVCHLVHLPLRLATELLFLGTAAAFALSLRRVRIPRTVATLVFAGVALHPGTFTIFDMPMSEGLFACLTLAALATIVSLIASRTAASRFAFAASLGVVLALLLHERGNDAVLIYGLAVYVVAAIVLLTLVRPTHWHGLPPALAAIGTVVATAVALNLAVLTANYVFFGYFGSNEIESPGEMKLANALMSIDTGESPIHKYIPITTRAREIAYGLSPTLAGFRTAIESDFRAKLDESPYTTFSRTGVKGQFDISDMFTVMSKVIAPPKTSSDETPLAFKRQQSDFQTTIAAEIVAALRAGKAKRRWILYLWDPFSPMLLDATTQSFGRLAGGIFQVRTALIADNFPFYGSLMSPLYNEMATRRLSMVRKGPLTGYLAVHWPHEPSSLAFLNNSVEFFARQGAPTALDEVLKLPRSLKIHEYDRMGAAVLARVEPGELPQMWRDPVSSDWSYYRFTVPPVLDRFHLYFGRLSVTDEAGATATCDDLGQGATIHAAPGTDGLQASCLVTSFEPRFNRLQRWGYGLQHAALAAFNACAFPLSASLMALTAAAGLVTGFRRRHDPRAICPDWERLAVLGAVAFVIAERMLFYAFIDATIFPLNDDRHLFDCNILVPPLVLLLGYELAFGLWAEIARSCARFVRQRTSPTWSDA